MIKILGMFVEEIAAKTLNLDYVEENDTETHFHIYAKDSRFENGVFDIELWESYGPCGSGYCMSSWGNMRITGYDKPLILTHKYTGPDIDGQIENDEETAVGADEYILVHSEGYKCPDIHSRLYEADEENEAFGYSDCGDDSYYPCGRVWVNMELFEELPRAMQKRPVYLFVGASGLGKSTLALKTDLMIFETDSVDTLPEEINADIIVVGNRNRFSLENIKQRVYDRENVEFITVYFSKEVQ